jgi:glycosyltransferase involved in cell wall biosynthesis
MGEVRLSIILPAHNEEALIGRAVSSALEAAERSDEPYEIIVVNDASTDRTAEIARGLGARVVDVNRRLIAAVRNEGARASRGRWLVFMDADTMMTAEVLSGALRALEGGAVGGGAGARFDGEVPLHGRIALAIVMASFRRARVAAGCFVFATREAFEAVGGFDETLYASEEVALSRAMGRRGRFVILREKVTTSGRKVRQYTAAQMARVVLSQAIKGPRGAWRSREGLEFWYDAPREDAGAEKARRGGLW